MYPVHGAHGLVYKYTSCMQSADLGACNPTMHCFSSGKKFGQEGPLIFSSQISQLFGLLIYSQASEKLSVVWQMLSARYVCLFCCWNIKNWLVKSKTMIFMYSCISKISQLFGILIYSQAIEKLSVVWQKLSARYVCLFLLLKYQELSDKK